MNSTSRRSGHRALRRHPLRGNVVTFVAPQHSDRVLRLMGLHLAARGRLVVGFGLDRDYPLADFLADAAVAGAWPCTACTPPGNSTPVHRRRRLRRRDPGGPHERSSPGPHRQAARHPWRESPCRPTPMASTARFVPGATFATGLLPAAAFRGCSRSQCPSAGTPGCSPSREVPDRTGAEGCAYAPGARRRRRCGRVGRRGGWYGRRPRRPRGIPSSGNGSVR